MTQGQDGTETEEHGAHEGAADARSEAPETRLSEAELVFCEFVRSTEKLDTRGFEELCAARPEHEAELRRVHFNWTRVSGILEHLQGGPTFGEKLRRRYGSDIDPGISLDGVSLDRGSAFPTSTLSASGAKSLARIAGSPTTRRYDVRDEVARGGMGAIYKIWDKDLRRTLAMKVMLRDATEGPGVVDERVLGRFLEEAQITGQLDHPGIVPVHDLGLDSRGRVYFTMRFVRGIELKQVLQHVRDGDDGWTRFRVLEILLRICEACAFAHSKGVVHRDLKPANVMVGRFGETYVMDWGLAKVVGRAAPETSIRSAKDISVSIVRTDRAEESPDSPLVTLDGDVVGTPSYMSPEQAMGKLEEVGPRSDIYAVGCVLYQLLTGHVPYVQDGARMSPHTVLGRLLEGPPTPIQKLAPRAPAELAAVCTKAMEREAVDRYPSMLDLAEDIRAFLEGRVVSAYDTGAVAEFRAWVSRNRGLAAASAAAVIIAILGLTSVLVTQMRSNAEVLAMNANLEESNRELGLAKASVEALAAAERESAEEARVQARLAEGNEELARRRSYVNQLTTVEYSLRVNEFGEAKRLLEECEERYRGWEWRNLSLRADASLLTVALYPRRPAHVRLTDDGERILVGKADSFFDSLAADTGESLNRLEPRQPLQSPPGWGDGTSKPYWSAISPDGRFAATWAYVRTNMLANSGSAPPILVYWDLDSGAEPTTRPMGSVTLSDFDPGPSGGVPRVSDFLATAIAVAPRTGHVALAIRDRVVLIDPATWEVTATLSGFALDDPVQVQNTLRNDDGHVRTMAFGPNGRQLAIALFDDTLRIVDLDLGEVVLELSGHDDAITALDLHPSRPWLASASRDKTVRVWDLEDGSLRATLVGHGAAVVSVAFDPTEEGRLGSGSEDSTARVWNLQADISPRILRGHDGAVNAIAFAADGDRVVTGSADDNTVKVWDLAVLDPYTEMDVPTSRAAFATEGTTAATFDPTRDTAFSATSAGAVWRWDARAGAPLARLEGPNAWIAALCVSPDGHMLAAASGSEVWIWDTETDAQLAHLEGHERRISDLLFLPDGRLVSASLDDTVAIWDVSTRERLLTYTGHGQDVRGLAVDPLGRWIASFGTRSELHLWDPNTGELIRSIEIEGGRVSSRINALAFHPEGKHLAGGLRGGDLAVWDVDTGEELMRRSCEAGPINRLTYHPDGSRIVSGHTTGALQVWGAIWGEPLLAFQAHSRGIGALQFDPKGQRLLTSALGTSVDESGDEPPRIWETSTSAQRRPAIRAALTIRDRVLPLIDQLFDELHFAADVKRRLATRSDLSQDERVAALRYATLRGDEPSALELKALTLVRPSTEFGAPDPQLAVRLAERAVELQPERSSTRATFGICLYYDDDWEAAIEHLQLALDAQVSIFNQVNHSRVLLATTYRDVAMHRAERGSKGPTLAFLVETTRGLLTEDTRLLDTRHYFLAEELAREAAELAPDDPRHRVTVGLILYRRGAYEEALAILEEAGAALRASGEQLEQLNLATSFQILCKYRLGRIERGDEVYTLLAEGVERDLALTDKVRATVADLRSMLGSIQLPFTGGEAAGDAVDAVDADGETGRGSD